MTSDQPRRRSLVDKLLHRNTSTPDTAQDSETQSTTGLIHAPPSSTRTITLPLEGGGTETLVVSAHSQTQVQSYLPVPSVSNPLPYEQIPNDQIPRDPSNSTPESWHFNRSTRKASIPASDTGENTTASSDVEKAHFASLMRQTKGMTPEEVKRFLEKRGGVDGAKISRRWEEGKGGEGYQQVVGPDAGQM